MKFARIINNIVVNITEEDPALVFHPSVASEFISVPIEIGIGWKKTDDEWVEQITIATVITEKKEALELSPMEIKLLFTSPERLFLKGKRSEDNILNDFFELVEDTHTVTVNVSRQSTKDGLNYCHALLVAENIISAEHADLRLEQILSGTVL
jgi:hypothetical protein